MAILLNLVKYTIIIANQFKKSSHYDLVKDTFEIIGMYHVIMGACTTYFSWPP